MGLTSFIIGMGLSKDCLVLCNSLRLFRLTTKVMEIRRPLQLGQTAAVWIVMTYKKIELHCWVPIISRNLCYTLGEEL